MLFSLLSCPILITAFSNKNDLVYDPFIGIGSVAKSAITNKRNFIGSEISKEYCDIAEKRIKEHKIQDSLFG